MPRHSMPGANIAGRIDYLIRKLNPGDREYTHAEIAAGIQQKTGIVVTPEYIGQLRAGKVSNPSMRTLAGLARFFGVPIDSFYDDEAARQVERDVELAVALRRAAVADLAMPLRRLTPEGVEDVVALVNRCLGESEAEGTGEGGAVDGDETDEGAHDEASTTRHAVESLDEETIAGGDEQRRDEPQRED